jgi:hypothetical protein
VHCTVYCTCILILSGHILSFPVEFPCDTVRSGRWGYRYIRDTLPSSDNLSCSYSGGNIFSMLPSTFIYSYSRVHIFSKLITSTFIHSYSGGHIFRYLLPSYTAIREATSSESYLLPSYTAILEATSSVSYLLPIYTAIRESTSSVSYLYLQLFEGHIFSADLREPLLQIFGGHIFSRMSAPRSRNV